MLSKRISTMLLSGAAAAAVTTSAAQAIFVFDVRATGATGTGNVVVNTKSVVVKSPGTVTFNLFGVIQPATDDGNPNNEANKVMIGSFLTNGGGVKGSLAATVVASMQNLGFQNGTPQDLDGDGDLDVGSNISTSAADYWAARTTDTTNGLPGQEALLGTMTLTVGAGGITALDGDTLLNFRKKSGAPNSVGSWNENGVTVLSNSSNVTSGNNVVLTPVDVPEPTTIGLISLAGLGILARRRK